MALTIFGLAGAALNPLTVVIAMSGFGLAYLGGKGCADDAAGIADLRERLERDRTEMAWIAERLLAIGTERRKRP